MSGPGSDNSIELPVPSDVAQVMEERRGRVEGTIDDEGNYRDTYHGEEVIGTRNESTEAYEYRWNIKT